MSAWAISMVKDEEDVIGPLLEHMLTQNFAGIIVADNNSSDRTREILDSFPIQVVDDPDPAYTQGDKLTNLGRLAHEQGATWILPFDADEWWFSPHGPIGEVLHDDLPLDVVKTWGHDHHPQPDDDLDELNPFRRICWREEATQRLPKVSYRYHPAARLHLGFHEIDAPGRRDSGLLSFRHFGYRTFEQMCRKVRQGKAAYDATTYADTYGTHWREMGAMDDEDLRLRWKAFCEVDGLIYDPCPGA